MPDGEEAADLRPLLFSIAYRMLGSVADAEDIVQATYVRYLDHCRQGREVESLRALLTTITTRLAIDELRSARVQRESYIGPWLPEPLLTSNEPNVADTAVTSDSLSMAFLVLLETLSPVERAVFLLREVFVYDYDEIARITGKSEANCRQLLTRARRHVDAGRRRFEADAAQRAALADRFFGAAERGALGPLVELLAEDVAFYGDGGSAGRGVRQPVFGRIRVQRVLDGIFDAYSRFGARFERCGINGGPGLLTFDAAGGLINVLTIDVCDNRICTVRSVINPDKLGHLGLPLSELAQRPRR
ncbi:RNA polymerase sigma factor SigJ [Mycolicibacterium sp. P1-5]|uniref:RNA polymerase sigma factor SigJ n=1 Tax=Mycolicibacterium sp. P1-5 TaxID=2024617 RepID=UPI0011EFCF85|nr:RNA polymerase sigma factor SigJ [Mycolicibacterium sp. P1-5]KAA0108576.1 sigma-70 family RNA polymerase sigma factor [Mycolicibacterium sp. P1-5]